MEFQWVFLSIWICRLIAFKNRAPITETTFCVKNILGFLQFDFGSLSPIVKTTTFLITDLQMFRKSCLKRPTEIPRYQVLQHRRVISMYRVSGKKRYSPFWLVFHSACADFFWNLSLRAEREARSESTSIYRRKVSMSGRPAGRPAGRGHAVWTLISLERDDQFTNGHLNTMSPSNQSCIWPVPIPTGACHGTWHVPGRGCRRHPLPQ